jgi:hypothetical protein
MKKIITLIVLCLVFTNCFSQGVNITITPVFTSPSIEVGGYFGKGMKYQGGVRYRPSFMSVPSIKSAYLRYNFPILTSKNPYAKTQGEARLYLGVTFGKMEINSEDFYFDGGVLQGNIIQNSYSVEFGGESFYGPRKRGAFFVDFAFGHVPNFFKPLVIGIAENTSKWDNGKIGTKWGANFGWRFYIGRKS